MKKLLYLMIGLLTVYLFYQMEYSQILSALSSIPVSTMFFLVGLQGITQLLIGLQWYDILKVNGVNMSFWTIMYVNLKGSVVEGVTPGVKIGGEAYKVVAIRELSNNKIGESVAYVLLQKLFSMTGFIFFSCVSGFYVIYSIEQINRNALLVYLLFSLFVLGVVVIALLRPENIMKKIPGRGKTTSKIKKVLMQYNYSVYKIRKKQGKLIQHLFLSFSIWLLFPMKMYILLRVFHDDMHLITPLAITFLAYWAGNIPLLPGGLGSFEATMTALISLLTELTVAQGMVVTVVFRFITFWMILLVGVTIVASIKFKESLETTRRVNHEKYSKQ